MYHNDIYCTSREKLQAEVKSLKSMLRELQMEKLDSAEMIRHLKGEVFCAEDAMLSEKDELVRAQLQVEMLNLQIEAMKEWVKWLVSLMTSCFIQRKLSHIYDKKHK